MKAPLFLGIVLAMAATSLGEPDVKFTKFSDIITTAPAGTIPSGRAWSVADIAKASESLSTHVVGSSAQFVVKMGRIENPNPASAVIVFSAMREDFRAKGRPYVLQMRCSIPRDKAGEVFSARENSTLKVSGKIASLTMGGTGENPILYVALNQCETVK